MAAPPATKATSRPRPARTSPPGSWRITEAMIWTTNSPVPTATAMAAVMATSASKPFPPSDTAVAVDDLMPQPVHHRVGRLAEVVGDGRERRVGDRFRRAADDVADTAERVGHLAGHQFTVQSSTATAP